jgi:hypothetical protein
MSQLNKQNSTILENTNIIKGPKYIVLANYDIGKLNATFTVNSSDQDYLTDGPISKSIWGSCKRNNFNSIKKFFKDEYLNGVSLLSGSTI